MEILLFLAPFVLVPAAVFAFLPARPRRVFGALAFLICFAPIGFTGPDNPLLFLNAILPGIFLGALLVELALLARAGVRRLRPRRRPRRPPQGRQPKSPAASPPNAAAPSIAARSATSTATPPSTARLIISSARAAA